MSDEPKRPGSLLGGLVDAHIRLRLLVGRSMVVDRKWDSAQLADFYATSTQRGDYLGGMQTAAGNTSYGAFVRSGCKAAGVEPRELQQYEIEDVTKLCKYIAGIVAHLDPDYLPHLPGSASQTWRDAMERSR